MLCFFPTFFVSALHAWLHTVLFMHAGGRVMDKHNAHRKNIVRHCLRVLVFAGLPCYLSIYAKHLGVGLLAHVSVPAAFLYVGWGTPIPPAPPSDVREDEDEDEDDDDDDEDDEDDATDKTLVPLAAAATTTATTITAKKEKKPVPPVTVTAPVTAPDAECAAVMTHAGHAALACCLSISFMQVLAQAFPCNPLVFALCAMYTWFIVLAYSVFLLASR